MWARGVQRQTYKNQRSKEVKIASVVVPCNRCLHNGDTRKRHAYHARCVCVPLYLIYNYVPS